MNKDSQFTLANRKQLTDMLADNYNTLRQKTKDKYWKNEGELRKTFINDHAEKNGAAKLKEQIVSAEQKIEQLKAQLCLLGFSYDEDGLALSGDDTLPIAKAINARIVKQLGTVRDIDARFDSAMVAMMTIATLADAEKLLKSVTEL
jgi:hypothetical protein